jgi:hypothetical protein
MHKPQSSTELRCSLRHAVECAERALASERKDSLAGVRAAFAALQEAVDAVDAARLEWFEISTGDEGELRALVQRVQSLVEELLAKVEGWQRPGSAARVPPRPAPSNRWLN